MLVKLSDIHIPRQVPAVASIHFSKTEAGNRDDIMITELDYESLLQPGNNLEEKMLNWAGEDLLKRTFYLNASGNHGKLVKLMTTGVRLNDQTGNDIAISPQFLYYYLYLKRNQLTVTTKAGPRISKEKLLKLAVPVPEIHAQLNVIATFKKLLEKYDTQIFKTRKQIDALIYENELVYAKAFKQLAAFMEKHPIAGDNPKIKVIKEAGLIQVGKTPNGSIKTYFGNSYPFFTQLALEQGRDIEHATKHLSERGIREAKVFEKDSLLICFIGPQFGRAGIARLRGACNSQMLSVTCNRSVLPEYLYCQVISPLFQHQMKKFSKNLSISKSDFEQLFIELPPLKKQAEIVSQLQKHEAFYAAKMAGMQASLEKLESKQADEFSNLIVKSKS